MTVERSKRSSFLKLIFTVKSVWKICWFDLTFLAYPMGKGPGRSSSNKIIKVAR